MADIDNTTRADWASKGLETYCEIVPTDSDAVVQDFLCDLMHYCDQKEIPFYERLDTATMMYVNELNQ